MTCSLSVGNTWRTLKTALFSLSVLVFCLRRDCWLHNHVHVHLHVHVHVRPLYLLGASVDWFNVHMRHAMLLPTLRSGLCGQCLHVQVQVHVCLHAHNYSHVPVHVHMHVRVHVHVHVHVYVQPPYLLGDSVDWVNVHMRHAMLLPA